MAVETPPRRGGSEEGEAGARRPGRTLYAAAALAAAAFAALLVYGLLAQAPDTTIDDRLARAQTAPAPGFDLELLERGDPGSPLGERLRAAFADGRVTLDELRGTPVVLNFWASWCLPCRDEAPVLERAWREDARTAGVLFLGLNMQDVRDDARAFLAEFRISYPNVRDRGEVVADDWGLTGIPETFFITRRGLIAGHVIGAIDAQELRDGIAAAVSGRPLAARSGGRQLPAQ